MWCWGQSVISLILRSKEAPQCTNKHWPQYHSDSWKILQEKFIFLLIVHVHSTSASGVHVRKCLHWRGTSGGGTPVGSAEVPDDSTRRSALTHRRFKSPHVQFQNKLQGDKNVKRHTRRWFGHHSRRWSDAVLVDKLLTAASSSGGNINPVPLNQAWGNVFILLSFPF